MKRIAYIPLILVLCGKSLFVSIFSLGMIILLGWPWSRVFACLMPSHPLINAALSILAGFLSIYLLIGFFVLVGNLLIYLCGSREKDWQSRPHSFCPITIHEEWRTLDPCYLLQEKETAKNAKGL